MVQQLTIFDAVPKKEAFVVGETVEVVKHPDWERHNSITNHQGFVGLKGRVVKVIRGLQYEVFFSSKNRTGIFRHGELIGVKRDDS